MRTLTDDILADAPVGAWAPGPPAATGWYVVETASGRRTIAEVLDRRGGGVMVMASGRPVRHAPMPDPWALMAALAKASEALEAVATLIRESAGVAGYHLNGDIMGWDEGDPPMDRLVGDARAAIRDVL